MKNFRVVVECRYGNDPIPNRRSETPVGVIVANDEEDAIWKAADVFGKLPHGKQKDGHGHYWTGYKVYVING